MVCVAAGALQTFCAASARETLETFFTLSMDRPGVVLTAADGGGLVSGAADYIACYVGKVTGARPVISPGLDPGSIQPGMPAIALEVGPLPYFRPDGYTLDTAEEGGRRLVRIRAASPAGLKYGAYALVRATRQNGREVEVPPLHDAANPWLGVRDLYISAIEWASTPAEAALRDELNRRFEWRNWPIARLQQYVDMADAMGYNAVQLTHSPVTTRLAGNITPLEEDVEKVRAMYERAHRNGMTTTYFLWGQQGVRDSGNANNPLDAEQFADTQAHWDDVIGKFGKHVDRWVLHWGDPGGCKAPGCSVRTPQEAANAFLEMLRESGSRADVYFSLWALRWGCWPGWQDDRQSVVEAGVLAPEVGIAMMRHYDAELAQAITAQGRKAGIWGWYINDIETNQGLHVHTGILDSEFDRLHEKSARACLDWYSLEDNNHILDIPSLYVGAQKLWNCRRLADDLLAEFSGMVWGSEGPKVCQALRAVAAVRCTKGEYRVGSRLWPNDYLCRLGMGQNPAAEDETRLDAALASLGAVRLNPQYVPKLPLIEDPAEYLGYLAAHLRYMRQFARVRRAYDEGMATALRGDYAGAQTRMGKLPELPETVEGCYGPLEYPQYARLRAFADTWRGRTFADNMALGRPVTASSRLETDPRFAPECAVNGLLCEMREEGWASSRPGPAWLKIDLGRPRPVRSVRIYNRAYTRENWDDNLVATPSKGDVFWGSADRDPSRGTVDADEPGYTRFGGFDGWEPSTDPASYQEIQPTTPVEARFIKVVLYAAANGNSVGTGEIEVR